MRKCRTQSTTAITYEGDEWLAPLLTLREVAAILRVSPGTVTEHVKKGIFPAGLKVGRGYRWKAETVRAWIAGRDV